MPATTLKQLVVGTQDSFATASDPYWRMSCVEDMALDAVQPVEEVDTVGSFGPAALTAEAARWGESHIEATASYEDLRVLCNGLFTSITESSSTGSPWNYPYAAPVSSTQVHALYSLEHGTTGASYTLVGAVGTDMIISGMAGEDWRMSADYLGWSIVAPSTPATLDQAVVNPIRMTDTTIYLDAFSTGTIGTTEVDASLIEFELTYTSERRLQFHAGSVYATVVGEGRPTATLKTVLEFNSDSQTLIDELLSSEVSRQVRIKAVSGSGTSQRSATLDLAGVLAEPVKLWDDRSGNMTVEINWEGKYSTGLGNWLALAVETTTPGVYYYYLDEEFDT